MCIFFNDTATTEIYTLSLHDALPIWAELEGWARRRKTAQALALRGRIVLQAAAGQSNTAIAAELGIAKHTVGKWRERSARDRDRKSTRLNSSYANISYAVFCLKKKTQ